MKSLHKVLDIIDTVAEVGTAGIRELSARTGFPPATTHRIVSTLVKRRYLKQDPVTKNYSLSLRFLELGTKVQQQFNLVSVARPHLERLMIEVKESTNLAVRDGDEIVYLDRVQNNDSMLQSFTKLGARVPLYATGVGKMFMSQWSDLEIEEYLLRTKRDPHTSHTLVQREDILREMARIRIHGYATDNEEMEEGVRCVAALVFDHNRRPTAAVSVSGAATRIPRERIHELGQSVKRCALVISRELGYPANSQNTKTTIKEVDHA